MLLGRKHENCFMKLTQQDMARLLDVDARTLRNWRTTKPYLYKIVMQGFEIEEVVKEAKEHYERLEKITIQSKGGKG